MAENCLAGAAASFSVSSTSKTDQSALELARFGVHELGFRFKIHFLKESLPQTQFFFDWIHFVNLSLNLDLRFNNFGDSKKIQKMNLDSKIV